MKRTFLIISSLLLLIIFSTQRSVSQDTSGNKKITIHNSDSTRWKESDSGRVSYFWGNIVMEHNGVVMNCDSAVLFPSGIFEAFSNTKVTNKTTVITGDVMVYNNNTSMAEVTGKIVYLTDGSSTLRTSRVDYNTATEIGYFVNEGTIVDSFRLLESKRGYYYSKTKIFEFVGTVQADTKDYLLISDSMIYNTNNKVFDFYSNTHIWTNNGYLYCDKGWYNSDNSTMFFIRNSYMLSSKQEIFADSIYYDDISKKGKLHSNIQVTDTAQKTIAMADFANFDINTEDFLLEKNPSIITYDNNDSTYISSKILYSVTLPKPKKILSQTTDLRNSNFNRDTIKGNTLNTGSLDTTNIANEIIPDTTFINTSDTINIAATDLNKIIPDTTFINASDTINIGVDTINIAATDLNEIIPDTAFINTSDTINIAANEIIHNPDTTFINTSDTLNTDVDSTYKELYAFGNVKLYRNDFQLKCDSLYFNSIDSIWRMYYDPILWDGNKMQIKSDSMKFLMKNGALDLAKFQNNAMIVAPEGNPDSTKYFNQLKSKNMDVIILNQKVHSLTAIGNVQTLAFSLSELTMNTAESSSMKILFYPSSKIHRISYYNDVTSKNDPLFLVREDQIRLPGYRWDIGLRPKSGQEVLNRILRPSEREQRETVPKPTFPITERIDKLETK